MASESDCGAFLEKFLLQLPTSNPTHASRLTSLTFAVKDIFDVEGYVTGFGNPDWARTHPVATSTAPVVLALLEAGATCVGKTIMDEMALSVNGVNKHYGMPINPCSPDRLPGGSSSGSAVAVGAKLVDFSLGTDTGGSVRGPASYCGIFGIRPSQGIISTSGVIPMSQCFDTVGWFARDPIVLNQVGHVLLQLPDTVSPRPTKIMIAEDCFQISTPPYDLIKKGFIQTVEKLYGGDIVNQIMIDDYVMNNVPSLRHFMNKEDTDNQCNIPTLATLSSVYSLIQRYEFKSNHGEWVRKVNPDLGPVISDRVSAALNTTGEHVEVGFSVKNELFAALKTLLEDFGVLVIPTIPGPPPKLETDASALESFRAKTYCLHSIAGVSGLCQVTMPLGMYNGFPVSISAIAMHGSDGFLLDFVESFYEPVKEEVAALLEAEMKG